MFKSSNSNFRNLIVGADTKVPLGNGRMVTPINFDNAATTPPFIYALNEMIKSAPLYSSVHRSAGYKSWYSTEIFERSRSIIANFVKADPANDTVIYVKNTTEAINKLSYRLLAECNGGIVLSTEMEHHSNDLPWRDKYQVKYVEVDQAGRLKLEDLQSKLRQYNGKVKLVAVTGASNVTGYLNPIYEIAEVAHKYKAKILVDGAQLIPHYPINMRPFNTSQHIDYLAFSGHKMYAPFGTGVLIGPKETFKKSAPEYTGGGTIQLVTPDTVIWDDPPYKEEAGTPNIMGVIGLLAAVRMLDTIGLQKIIDHEMDLWHYTVEKLKNIPALTIHCDTNPNQPRLGIIPFNIVGLHHALVARILAEEAGISVRSGCFCAQPYIQKLLNIVPSDMDTYLKNPHSPRPGMVRVSFGLYNDFEEVDIFIKTVYNIVQYKEFYIEKYKHAIPEGRRIP